MSNQLFIVCPFSSMETYLQQKYGKDIFFLTFPGAVIQFNETDYILGLKDFIEREKINHIYFVNDTSCRIIEGVIKRNIIAGFLSNKSIEALYVNNYFSTLKNHSLYNQKYKLAEIILKNQIQGIRNSEILGTFISAFGIEVKGLLTSKEFNLYKEIHNKEKNTIHELSTTD